MSDKKVALIILDGWGQGAGDDSDGIFMANTPFIDGLYKNTANAKLITYGNDVGLPDAQMGNSEVGHLNIGAGRIVYQDLLKIDTAISDGSFFNTKALNHAFENASSSGNDVHLIGLVSDGGVHSSIEHLYSLCTLAKQHAVDNLFIHAITDGRDCGPKTGKEHIRKLQGHLEGSGGRIASIIGRYYAMDRDNRWERIKKAYDLLVYGKGNKFQSPVSGIQASYDAQITDEFIEPIAITDDSGKAIARIKKGDTVICFNFRTDRCREITVALTQRDLPEFEMSTLELSYYTMTNYDDSFKNVQVIYNKDNLLNTLGETISKCGKKQLRIAETEKYPHVTFFFSGGREATFDGETRIIVSSPKVATYDQQPEMSAYEVTDRVCEILADGRVDFICLNFANPDMVGHTGVQEAIVKAVETVDDCARKVIEKGVENGYSFVIIADHGNADKMINEDGSPHTAHTTNPVPVFVIDHQISEIRNGILADIAPTILELMNIRKPDEMTGTSLLSR